MTKEKISTEELIEALLEGEITTQRKGWPSGEGKLIADHLKEQSEMLAKVRKHLEGMRIGKHTCCEKDYPRRCQECEHNRDIDEALAIINPKEAESDE